MKNEWLTGEVPFKYMLSDLTLFKRDIVLKILRFKIISENSPPEKIPFPDVKLAGKEKGYLLRSIPLPSVQPAYRVEDGYIYYVADQFSRYYIDLQQTFEEYIAKFSSKTRSTIRRKIKKFTAKCNGNMNWKSYRTVDELAEFYRGAREVSSKSYQEKLLDSGLPDTEQFQKTMASLARDDSVRGYLLFDENKPVAYMYCPVQDSVLLYQYLGYDPEYIKWSVGTILHWFAFEDILGEKKFRYFDFTEGQSEHKRLYSTGSLLCGNVYIFPKSISAWLLVKSHNAVNTSSKILGNFLERANLKSKIIKMIRFKNNR